MTLYVSPDTIKELETPEREGYLGQFVRVGDNIALGLNGEFNRASHTVALEDGLFPEFEEALGSWSGLGEVDAGLIAIDPAYKAIAIFSGDTELKIPTDRGVRVRTARMIGERSEGFDVETILDQVKLSDAQRAIGGTPERR